MTTVTTTTTAVQPTTEAPSIGKASLLGDVDLDGKAGTATDLVKLSKYLVNGTIFPLNDEALANADIDQNGKITSVDASTLIEVVTGNVKLG